MGVSVQVLQDKGRGHGALRLDPAGPGGEKGCADGLQGRSPGRPPEALEGTDSTRGAQSSHVLASRALLEASEEEPPGDRKREMGERVSRDAPPICPRPSPVTRRPGFGAQCTTLCACPPWGSESRVHTEGDELQGLCPKTLPAPRLQFLRSWGVRMHIISGGNSPSLRISFHDVSSLPPHPASHPKC